MGLAWQKVYLPLGYGMPPLKLLALPYISPEMEPLTRKNRMFSILMINLINRLS